MEARGFQYESPNAIKNVVLNLEISLHDKSPEYIRQQIMARFDTAMVAGDSCDREVKLSEITRKVIYEYEQDFIEKYRDLLESSGVDSNPPAGSEFR